MQCEQWGFGEIGVFYAIELLMFADSPVIFALQHFS